MSLALFGTVAATRGDVVAEWKFDATTDAAPGTIVTLDAAAAGASTQSKLDIQSHVTAGPTGLAAPWAPYLLSGYLEVGPGGGESSKNQFGLVTQDNPAGSKNAEFRKYFGYSGVTTDKGGSVCLVVSPSSDWTAPTRRGLFSTGHVVEGMVSLAIQKSGQLDLRIGGKKDKMVDATLMRKWEPGKWYFIGASWQGDKKALLVVYEMGADPKAALAAADTAESTDVCPICEQPRFDPLAVGATWVNTGGEAFTTDGAEARIAYARVDNAFADQVALKAVLSGLAAPAPAK